jgi:uncharacterized protein YggE
MKTGFWRRANRRALILGGLALVALVAIGCQPKTEVTVAPTGELTGGISVSGTGTVTVVPDIAILQLGVEVTSDTVGDARNEAAQAMDRVRASLAEHDIDDDDIRTTSFNIYPQYDFRSEQRRLIGFTVNNQIAVTVRDIDTAGEVLDDAIVAGGDATRVSSISFSVDDPDAVLDEARADAVADARNRAETLASAAGVSVGAPMSISESGGFFPTPIFRAEFASAQADDGGFDTPIAPGEQELTVTVQVIFELQ